MHKYLYMTMETAKPINFEEESLIEYFFNDLPDTRLNKALFYQARNKRQLKTQMKYSLHLGKKETVSGKILEIVRRGFKCSDVSHLQKERLQIKFKQLAVKC